MNGGVSRLTKIRAQNLSNAPLLSEVYNDFSKWCGDDFTLCTWGPDDIPALLDNLIMYGIAPASVFYWCDLQEIFGTEIHEQLQLGGADAGKPAVSEKALIRGVRSLPVRVSANLQIIYKIVFETF